MNTETVIIASSSPSKPFSSAKRVGADARPVVVTANVGQWRADAADRLSEIMRIRQDAIPPRQRRPSAASLRAAWNLVGSIIDLQEIDDLCSPRIGVTLDRGIEIEFRERGNAHELEIELGDDGMVEILKVESDKILEERRLEGSAVGAVVIDLLRWFRAGRV